ncbi:flagellar FlbD family protein [Paenibacillus contaminans]|uniref:Flagellar protein D n=1 Tax=Paenibacillus contaminans TaxID=450362 RepID=A0A329MVX5_9BACL|nr:flagellar FlbD family protein [Paenibacillus contaminans]RAV22713.1 flagellar protein D [Paenibacillus contaminans]
MITVTRLNGKPITVNALLIETIDEIPETMLILTTGKKIVVLEKAADVVELITSYVQRVGAVRGTIMSKDLEGS